MITLYELIESPDKTLMVGNSIEVDSPQEAALLIKAKKAKHADAPIGVVPEFLGKESAPAVFAERDED